MPTIRDINDCRQQVFEGMCRGGPMNGMLLRHPIHFYPMSLDGAPFGQYLFAINSEWIWVEKDYRKTQGGLLE
jgi:hypothetical protein